MYLNREDRGLYRLPICWQTEQQVISKSEQQDSKKQMNLIKENNLDSNSKFEFENKIKFNSESKLNKVKIKMRMIILKSKIQNSDSHF